MDRSSKMEKLVEKFLREDSLLDGGPQELYDELQKCLDICKKAADELDNQYDSDMSELYFKAYQHIANARNCIKKASKIAGYPIS